MTGELILIGRTLLEYEVGNFGQGLAFLERLLEVLSLNPPGPSLAYLAQAIVIPAVARIIGMVYRLDVAERGAATVLPSPSAFPAAAMSARTGLALLAVLGTDVVAAAELE